MSQQYRLIMHVTDDNLLLLRYVISLILRGGNSLIDIQALTQTFVSRKEHFTALKAVDLTINENEFFTLLGPSGCGKTTLLRAIAGFVYPTSGSITLHGSDLLALPPFSRPVNTVFQNYALFPHKTVAENVGFGLLMLKKPKREIEDTVAEMLELVRMSELADRRTTEISGGQQQRVALARALAPKPEVLLLDEPLSALDFKLRKEMQVELKRLQTETGITFVFVTHDQEEALTMSDRIAVMNEGRILQIGAPQEIYEHPAERFVADFIGETNFLPAAIVSTDGDTAIIELGGGARTAAKLPGSTETRGSITIAIRPEYVRLTDPDTSLLQGTLDNTVYTGTDTQFHVVLDEGSRVVVRRQNSPGGSQPFELGGRVGIEFDSGVAQILKD